MTPCHHIFIEDNGIEYCSLCGVEELLIQHVDISLTKEFYSNDNSRLLEDLNDMQRKELNLLTERILVKHSLRGNRKKAIVAVSYMFVNFNRGVYYTYDDIIKKFSIDRKKLSFAIRLFLTSIAEYRNLIIYPKDFSYKILKECLNSKEISKEEVDKLCDIAIKRNKKLANLSPYNVCACIIYKFFLSTKIKRCNFINSVKVSDSSIQKILPLLENIRSE